MFRYLFLAVFLSILSLDAKAQDEFSLDKKFFYSPKVEEFLNNDANIIRKIEKIQKIQGYIYEDPNVIATVILQVAQELNLKKYAEKLEFLGDAYLRAIFLEIWMYRYPQWTVHELSNKGIEKFQSKAFLGKLGQRIKLNQFIAGTNSDSDYDSNDHAAVSRFIKMITAAIWIDGGKNKATDWVMKALVQSDPEFRQHQMSPHYFGLDQLLGVEYIVDLTEMVDTVPEIYYKAMELQALQNYQYSHPALPAFVFVRKDLATSHEKVAADLRKAFDKLELLGDRYLEFVIAEFCLNEYPEFTMKQINLLHEQIKSNKILAEVAGEIGLGRLITKNSTSKDGIKLIADIYEASIAILWLTAGQDKTYEWVQKLFKAKNHEYLILLDAPIVNFEKWTKEVFNIIPSYKKTEVKISEEKQYIVEVFLSDNFITKSQEVTLKRAKKSAVEKALQMALEGKIKLD
jgi:dsRNA-specific ribonuclease